MTGRPTPDVSFGMSDQECGAENKASASERGTNTDSGWVEGVDVNTRDTTDQQRKEQGRSVQALYLESIIENQPGLVWLKDAEGRSLAVNTAFAASCGRHNPEAVVGLTDLDIWPKPLAEKYRTDDAEVMWSGAPKIVEELRESLNQVELFRTLVECSGDCFYVPGGQLDHPQVWRDRPRVCHLGHDCPEDGQSDPVPEHARRR